MEIIIFLAIAFVINSLIAAAKKKEEEQRRRAQVVIPQRRPEETQDMREPERDERRMKPFTVATNRMETTLKPNLSPKAHSPKAKHDPDCEPHKPVVSIEGDPHYRKGRPRKPNEADAVNATGILSNMRYDNDSLVKGIIYSEIFGKPKSRR